MQTKITIAVLLFLAAFQQGFAHEAGDWVIRAGLSTVDAKSNNHPVVDVGSGTALTFNVTRMLTDHWGIELLAATPFDHNIYLKDGTRVGDTEQLPPTLSVQYHFNPAGKFQPYLGAGINYTLFFKESLQGPLQGGRLRLDDSVGVAFELGADFELKDRWWLNGSLRYMDIETDAYLNGDSIGTVKIDPMVFGIHLGKQF